jgi:hypothetical protein
MSNFGEQPTSTNRNRISTNEESAEEIKESLAKVTSSGGMDKEEATARAKELEELKFKDETESAEKAKALLKKIQEGGDSDEVEEVVWKSSKAELNNLDELEKETGALPEGLQKRRNEVLKKIEELEDKKKKALEERNFKDLPTEVFLEDEKFAFNSLVSGMLYSELPEELRQNEEFLSKAIKTMKLYNMPNEYVEVAIKSSGLEQKPIKYQEEFWRKMREK